MNGFDYIALAALVSAALRGYRQGLAAEFYRLLRLSVALLAGTSLYSMVGDLITNVLNIKASLADPAMFVGISVTVWSLLRRFRLWLEAWLRARVTGKYQAMGGALAAGLKALLLTGGLVTLFSMASWMPGHETVAQDSMFARLLAPFIPGN
ncbi:MAG TPA: CvpA family protein [Kiritimatiellia bacterium]|nr:CvpA family protein [Kiritimatiellia bacterium]